MLRSEKLGIEIEQHPFDRGYWARFNGQPRPTRGEPRKGWETCDEELTFDRTEKATMAANARWDRKRAADVVERQERRRQWRQGVR